MSKGTVTTTPAVEGGVRRLPTWRYVLHLIRFQPWLYAALAVLEVLFFAVFPQFAAWLTFTFFDLLTGEAQVGLSVWAIVWSFASVRTPSARASRSMPGGASRSAQPPSRESCNVGGVAVLCNSGVPLTSSRGAV